jgi:hypothetical protein
VREQVRVVSLQVFVVQSSPSSQFTPAPAQTPLPLHVLQVAGFASSLQGSPGFAVHEVRLTAGSQRWHSLAGFTPAVRHAPEMAQPCPSGTG